MNHRLEGVQSLTAVPNLPQYTVPLFYVLPCANLKKGLVFFLWEKKLSSMQSTHIWVVPYPEHFTYFHEIVFWILISFHKFSNITFCWLSIHDNLLVYLIKITIFYVIDISCFFLWQHQHISSDTEQLISL